MAFSAASVEDTRASMFFTPKRLLGAVVLHPVVNERGHRQSENLQIRLEQAQESARGSSARHTGQASILKRKARDAPKDNRKKHRQAPCINMIPQQLPNMIKYDNIIKVKGYASPR